MDEIGSMGSYYSSQPRIKTQSCEIRIRMREDLHRSKCSHGRLMILFNAFISSILFLYMFFAILVVMTVFFCMNLTELLASFRVILV